MFIAAKPKSDAMALHVIDGFDAGTLAGDVNGGAAMAELRYRYQRRAIGACGDHLIGMANTEAVGTLRHRDGRLKIRSRRQEFHIDAGLLVVALFECDEGT